MGMHMPILPDADRGMPRVGVAPYHGRIFRSGVAAPAAVAQLQCGQPHPDAPGCTSERQ